MSYFQQIYIAAKQKDTNTINSLLAKGACIDERERSEFFSSPAGKLAKEGDIDSALFLMNRFGAGVEFIVNGLLNGGYDVEANKLLEQYQLSKDNIHVQAVNHHAKEYYEFVYTDKDAEYINNHKYHQKQHIQAALVAGDMDYAKELEKRYHIHLSRADYLSYAGHGGHLDHIERLYAKSHHLPNHHLPKDFAYWVGANHGWFPVNYQSARFANAKLALHSLSFISYPKFFQALVDNLSKGDYFNYDIKAVAEKARKIHDIMTNEKVDYAEALRTFENKKIDLPKSNFFNRSSNNVNSELNQNVTDEKEHHAERFQRT